MDVERCELTELPVNQCGCRVHASTPVTVDRTLAVNRASRSSAFSFGSAFESVWDRIRSNAGGEFQTTQGLPFTYRLDGSSLRVTREGVEINRALSKTNFAKAATMMPVARPGELKGRQGSSYTWAILMDTRIRSGDW